MPYRTELRRPDLKGTFRCSLCNKIFCHSSSLSRHRMQAHFKSYTCTLCNKEITSNETLRAHMYKKHQISRMFMCRCCNWAFPDKTSLHIHMQAMATGSPGNVSIIAKSCPSPPLCPSSMVDVTGTSPASADLHCASMGAIFPTGMTPTTRDVISHLRERSMATKTVSGPPSGLDLSSLFPAFSKFLPRVAQRGLSPSVGNGKVKPEPVADDDDDDDQAIKCEMDDRRMDESDVDDELDGSGPGKSDASSPAELQHHVVSPRSPSSSSSVKEPNHCSTPRDGGDTAQEVMVNGGGLGLGALYMDPSGQADLPILRSAISASPLNSMLYHKKLNNALRNKAHHHKHVAASPLLSSGFSSLMYATKPFSDHLFAAAAAVGYHHPAANGFLPAVHPLFSGYIGDKDDQSSGGGGGHNWGGQQMPSPAESPGSTGSGRCPSAAKSATPVTVTNDNNNNNNHTNKELQSCFECHLMKGRVAQAENRCRFLESKTTSQESKISRLETRISTLEANNRRYENETHLLRDHCDKLERRILDCQELALRYLQGQAFRPEATEKMLLEILESCCVYK